MKNIFKKFFAVFLILVLALLCVTACGDKDKNPDEETPSDETPGGDTAPVVYSLVLEASKTEVARGESVTLSSAFKAEGKDDLPSEDATYSIVSGADYATLSGNTLTVLNTAPHGTKITVKAQEGATSSNEVTLTVSVPAESISISAAGGITNIIAGQSVILSATVAPTGAEADVAWAITEGADSAVISGNVLVINASAITGTTVKVQASVGAVKSEELSFTVGYPLEGITISAIGSLNILAGTSAQVGVALDPENTTATDYTLVFVNDCSAYATVSGNIITVAGTAVTGDKIQVKAVAGDVESNVITYTVGYPLTSLTAALVGSANVNRGNTAVLSATLNPTNATNGSYVWQITEGADYATVTGNAITVNGSAPIGALIKVKAVAGSISSNEVTIIVGTPIETIGISSTAPAVLDRGGSYPITVNATPTGASLEAISWVVSEGADYATVAGNTLYIAANTPAGTVVKLCAASGSVTSNVISYTVGVPLESIEIAMSGSTNIDPDGSKVISAALTPANASDTDITWVISEGSEYAGIVNGVITVNPDAPIGAIVSFYAQIGEVKSNSISITVGTPIVGIEISAIGSSVIVKGNSVALAVAVSPSNASASLINWQITEGSEYASVLNNVLTVSGSADTGATVKLKAVFGSVESNELVFTVAATQDEINKSTYYIDLQQSSVTVDKKGGSTPVVIGGVIDGNLDAVTGVNLVYTVTEGAEYVSIEQDGNNCYFTALGHGNATVTVSIPDHGVSESISVKTIVPPDAIDLPEVFKQRTDIEYAFSKVDPTTGNVETLAFLPTVRGSKVCTDYKITFTHTSGAASDDIAIYEDGKITFKMLGKVTATVESTSGSKVEARATFNFDINDGYNVESFVELYKVVGASWYNGQKINLVVLEKPKGYNSYEYGYDIVPPAALKDLDAAYAHITDENERAALIVYEIMSGHPYGESNGLGNNRIQAVNKSVWINGNNHKIDASQLRVYTKAEYDAYYNKFNPSSYYPAMATLFSAEPYVSSGEDVEGVTKGMAHNVNFYNIEVVGNCPVDYKGDKDTSTVIGCYRIGIKIGIESYTTDYYVDCNNLTATAFKDGIHLTGIVGNGKISNISAYNCYASGLVVSSSIVTLENMTFGKCGACAVEISPGDSDKAGVNENENSKLTFAGTVDAEDNLNAGDSLYFQNYTVQGYTVPQIVGYNIQDMATNDQVRLSHIMNARQQFVFISLVFADLNTFTPNKSEVLYPAYQAGGIIDIKDIPADTVDTTHEYITMEIKVPIEGVGSIGTAIFLNMNYTGE